MTKKMTREEAIRNYVENLIGDDLAVLMEHMHACDGCFEEVVADDMAEFDEVLANHTPLEIAQMIWFGGGEFNPNDEYFRFGEYGNLESLNWGDVVAEAEGLVDDIIEHLVDYYGGDTPWPDLDNLVDADDDTLFDENYEEVEEEEEE